MVVINSLYSSKVLKIQTLLFGVGFFYYYYFKAIQFFNYYFKAIQITLETHEQKPEINPMYLIVSF